MLSGPAKAATGFHSDVNISADKPLIAAAGPIKLNSGPLAFNAKMLAPGTEC